MLIGGKRYVGDFYLGGGTAPRCQRGARRVVGQFESQISSSSRITGTSLVVTGKCPAPLIGAPVPFSVEQPGHGIGPARQDPRQSPGSQPDRPQRQAGVAAAPGGTGVSCGA